MVSDFFETWDLVRKRFVNEYAGLTSEQLNWRLHPGTLTIGESAIHVYGVEVSFLSQLMGTSLDEFGARVKSSSVDGVINDNPFPFGSTEITPEQIGKAEALARAAVQPVITDLTDEIRARQIKSALGPIIDGTGAMARLAYHPAYHQAQAYMIKTAPGFPTA
jgi:hypothetical protein